MIENIEDELTNIIGQYNNDVKEKIIIQLSLIQLLTAYKTDNHDNIGMIICKLTVTGFYCYPGTMLIKMKLKITLQ